jgi:hypothetical protein
MLSKLFPLIFAAVGAGAGIGAGILLEAGPSKAPAEHSDAPDAPSDTHEKPAVDTEFIKLNNQFVVPVVLDDRIDSLVVVALSLEVTSGHRETVYALEPKLRDGFLRVLFDHANMGGFHGAFTDPDKLDPLRTALLETARQQLGERVRAVLIVDIARQDS